MSTHFTTLRETVTDSVQEYTPATKGVSRKTPSNRINTLLAANSKGSFSDTGWAGVDRLFKLMREAGYDYDLVSADYRHNEAGEMIAKVWKFQIPFLQSNGRQGVMYGNIVASLFGTKANPTERYDLAAYVS